MNDKTAAMIDDRDDGTCFLMNRPAAAQKWVFTMHAPPADATSVFRFFLLEKLISRIQTIAHLILCLLPLQISYNPYYNNIS